jgi:amino acid adenylation domain-containing protein/non-ribosomal peptide synthase protein (TIGR01720 family)
LLTELRQARVRIWVEGNDVRYQAPRGALTPDLLAELRGRKGEIIEFVRQAQAGTEALPLGPVPRDGDLQISLAQHRLWVLDQIEGPNPTYNISLALRLTGALDVAAMRRSLQAILRRHESLRTSFQVEGEAVRPVIAAECRLPWSVVDLQHLPADQKLAEVRRQARDEAMRPFDLRRAPLVRFVLWTLGGRDHVLLMNMHHIVADGRSIEVLAEDLATFYAAYCDDRDPDLPDLPLQYADFASHQRRWLTDNLLQGQLDYWKKQLAGLPPLLELPTDRPRTPDLARQGSFVSCSLARALVDSLKTLTRQSGVTLYMALLAGAAALLARYTGADDIPIACPATHRNRPELERLVGFFVNTLVLRFDLSGNPSFRELLSRTRAVLTGALANQQVPFDKVVDTLRIERDPGYPPLAQFSMVMLDSERARPKLRGLETKPFDFDKSTARYDLALELYESDGAIDIFWIYNTGLFDADTVMRMAQHLRTLFEAALAVPDRGVDDLALLDPSELRTITRTWNDTQVDPPQNPFIHRMFEAQADVAPGSIALALDGQHVTYGELNARANQLARRLIELGVGPDVLAGICLDRSVELVVGVLGVLKAGGAYVALDPAHPRARLAFMLEDSRARLLLTHASLAESFASDRLTVIGLDASGDLLLGRPADNPDRDVAAHNLAYVIYTSGSTGRPKGCQIEHGNLSNYLNWARRHYYPGGAGGSFGLFTSLAFDLTVTSLFLPLIRGRTLRIFPRDATLDRVLRGYFEAEAGLDSIKITPAHISLLPALGLTETKVGVAVVGGEQLLPNQVACLRGLNPNIRIYNEYGPTEATVGCTAKEIGPDETRILIGRPIDNTRVYVLDKQLQPLPVGVPGELYIGGKGLARSYLNRPDLTADRFIADPFSGAADARLYRSGDLARWRPDGNLECLGRTDDQVKIHGVRIELGEIEAVLAEHPAVQQAAVLAIGENFSGKRLVAYVGSAPAPSAAELRKFLSAKLPDYMVPAVFVVLDRLPLTVNGKINRGALPAPNPRAGESADAPALPRTAAERTLAGIWSQLLGREQIGIHDNFFELGGDSIMSIQAVSRANQAGLRLSPRQLLQHPTIAGTAALAEIGRPVHARHAIIGQPVPLTPIQHWFFEQDLPQPHHFNQTLLLEVREPLRPDLLAQCVEHLLSHHDALRMRFRYGTSGWQQEVGGLDRAVPFAGIDLSGLAGPDRAAAIAARSAELQTQLGLDGDLMRVAYFDCGAEQPAHLLWVIHHLVVDSVSWRILLDDLWTAYRQLQGGRSIQLPPKTTAFQHWATRLVEYARSDAPRQEQDLWLAESRSQVVRLPVDRRDGANTRGSSRQVRVALTAEETASLLRDVPSVYRTQIREVLLAALARAFAPWTSGGTLPVDLEGHGREDMFEDVDLSRTIGWFTTLAPVLLKLDGARDWAATLQRVKEELRRIPNGGLGYGVLKYLGGDAGVAERLRALPQAEVCFNYLGQLDRTLPASAPFGPSRESSGPYASPDGARKYLLEIDGHVENGELQFRCQYGENLYDAATIERFAQGLVEALRALIAHCGSPEAGSDDASDFRLAGLDQDQLRKVAKLLNAVRTH